MSFREKIRWAALEAMILAFGWYFLAFPWQIASTPAGVWVTAGMLAPVTIGIIVVMTLCTAIAAIRSPGDVDIKEDERERGFHLLGTHFAYYPLVAAEIIRIATQLFPYRRGY